MHAWICNQVHRSLPRYRRCVLLIRRRMVQAPLARIDSIFFSLYLLYIIAPFKAKFTYWNFEDDEFSCMTNENFVFSISLNRIQLIEKARARMWLSTTSDGFFCFFFFFFYRPISCELDELDALTRVARQLVSSPLYMFTSMFTCKDSTVKTLNWIKRTINFNPSITQCNQFLF